MLAQASAERQPEDCLATMQAAGSPARRPLTHTPVLVCVGAFRCAVVGGLAGSRALASVDGPLNIASWLNHTQDLFSSAGEVLGQELQDGESEGEGDVVGDGEGRVRERVRSL